MDASWRPQAACREVDPESMFVQGAAQHEAKRVCWGCSVRVECLAEALDARLEYGVWGGMTERERRRLLLRHPQVRSWRKTLAAARRQYDESKTG